MCPSDSSSHCSSSCGAPAHRARSTCTASYQVNLLGSILPRRLECPGCQGLRPCEQNETQPQRFARWGPTQRAQPPLLSPLLPGLGMRPTYFFSWPFSWGCSMGKAPIGWPFCDPSSRMGAAPHSGDTCCFPVRYWGITTDLTLWPPAPLSQEEMAQRLCLQHVSWEPGSWNPLCHKGLRGNRGAGPRPTIKGAESGEGLPKRWQVCAGCGRRKAVPTAQAHRQTWPCKVTGSQSNRTV